ncbi:MAG: 2,3,4,5-tetrahydropyridine-2,6-dicarboxylate N-succinyltransferase [Flavobacteriales bacterium]|nr:2,3,4,5-tetrahydropyridine-2,6-dicarboxylate N-succinyltransferase [Flavobacteriales bacterium]|tara:strand:- start:1650 stop:2810 length:1161 start_codon:yes stop_codon:yes gene_type:complete
MATVEEFKNYVASVEAKKGYVKPLAFGLGVKRSKENKTLDVFFPLINWEVSYGTAAVFADVANIKFGENAEYILNIEQLNDIYNKFSAFHDDISGHQNIIAIKNFLENFSNIHSYYSSEIVVYFLFDKTESVASATEGYFKLQALSQRCIEPHGLNLDGAFGKLNNIAWTNKGPVLPEDLSAEISKYIFTDPLQVSHIDKFPYMVNYHAPSGTRVVSGSQVRLGAYLGEGTTVMPAGYVNFNAGTKGNAMVEGRVSGGVVVDKNTDIGGGASIMGTLSGGNKNVISIGQECLLGANAGTGISLGFGCTIAAGVYITAGSKISLYNSENQPVNIKNEIVSEGQNVVKGMDLNGKDKLLFIQDSQSGKLICKPNPKTIELNEALHVND